MRTPSIFIITFILVVLSSGCSMQQGESNVDFKYQITASEDINPNINGEPSPVLVRVYQLSNKVNFQNAPYEALFDNVHTALGAEFISINEYLVHPGTNNPVELEISENVKYLGVAVGYRSIDMVNWRAVIAVPDNHFWNDSGIEIKVDTLSVRVIEL